MSDKNSKFFNEINQKKAIEWFNEKWPLEKRQCEICGEEKWSISADFTTPVVFDKGIQIGGTSYPTVNIICQNCGNTKYFNAVKMGLIEEKKEKKNELF